jgi:hypothetical protein
MCLGNTMCERTTSDMGLLCRCGLCYNWCHVGILNSRSVALATPKRMTVLKTASTRLLKKIQRHKVNKSLECFSSLVKASWWPFKTLMKRCLTFLLYY